MRLSAVGCHMSMDTRARVTVPVPLYGVEHHLIQDGCKLRCVTAKRRERRKAKEKTRQETRTEGKHLGREPQEEGIR